MHPNTVPTIHLPAGAVAFARSRSRKRAQLFLRKGVAILKVDLAADELLGDCFVDFYLNLIHDLIDIVFVLHLQLLVVAPALVRRPLLEDLAQPKEDLCGPPGLLSRKITDVVSHELQVNRIFFAAPPPHS